MNTQFYRSNPQHLRPGFVTRTHCPDCGSDMRVRGNRVEVPGQVARCRKCHGTKAANAGKRYTSGAMSSAAKLTGEQVAEIRQSTLPGTVLAKKFGVKPNAIYLIRKGQTWK